MREIGSEFWIDADYLCESPIETSKRKVNLLSGRTALDFIIRDAQMCGKLESVMLPSYCCKTMIEPFIRNHVKVNFYSVRPDEIIYDFTNDCDAVLVINYFGYITPEMIEIARKESERSKTVIYDGTHMIGGNSQIEVYADYSLCSYRKWMYCNWAIATKFTGDFVLDLPTMENIEYNSMRNEAANLKKKYIDKGNGEKDTFLNLYRDAEELLECNYVGYRGEPKNINIHSLVSQRKENAKYIMEIISQYDEVQLLRYYTNNDVPLFVPILLKDEATRNALRKYLIEKSIYCPVHWPLSSLHSITEGDKEIYTRELSLLCDQRYNKEDINHEVYEIEFFLKKGIT